MDTKTNYLKVVEMTDKEKLDMYLKCTKKELAKMLVEANKQLSRFTSVPFISDDNRMRALVRCKSFADCTNPHYDCIDCPLRFGAPSSPIITTSATAFDDLVSIGDQKSENQINDPRSNKTIRC